MFNHKDCIIAAVVASPLAMAMASEPVMSGFLFDPDPVLAGVDRYGRAYVVMDGDTIHMSFMNTYDTDRSARLTNDDYTAVAEKLGVEPAAIKAVVEIETGQTLRGFFEPGKPLVNFDLNVFKIYAARNGLDLSKYKRSHPEVFAKPDDRKYGSRHAAQFARLEQALEIDSLTAIQGTFWGMFQLGGFNWKKCGMESPEEFIDTVSRSERDQLELFANFIRNSGLLKSLKTKDWATFAKGYNGPGYAARGYHTKLAAAYRKYSRDSGSIPE